MEVRFDQTMVGERRTLFKMVWESFILLLSSLSLSSVKERNLSWCAVVFFHFIRTTGVRIGQKGVLKLERDTHDGRCVSPLQLTIAAYF